jgi:hypothetical protein
MKISELEQISFHEGKWIRIKDNIEVTPKPIGLSTADLISGIGTSINITQARIKQDIPELGVTVTDNFLPISKRNSHQVSINDIYEIIKREFLTQVIGNNEVNAYSLNQKYYADGKMLVSVGFYKI